MFLRQTIIWQAGGQGKQRVLRAAELDGARSIVELPMATRFTRRQLAMVGASSASLKLE